MTPKSDMLFPIVGKSDNGIILLYGDAEWMIVGITNFFPIFIREKAQKSLTTISGLNSWIKDDNC